MHYKEVDLFKLKWVYGDWMVSDAYTVNDSQTIKGTKEPLVVLCHKEGNDWKDYAFNPTKYDTTICNTKFIGIICKPTCSVRYTIIFGMYPGASQHGATKLDGISAP